MSTVATRCTRLELWSGLQCAGGVRRAIWPNVLACVADLTLGLDSSLTVDVPLDAEATGLADKWQVLRVWDADDAWDEWVIMRLVDNPIEGRATITAGPVTLLLSRAGLVTETVSTDGIVRPEVERVGLSPATLMRTLVVDPCVALGLAWVLLGTVESVAVTDVSLKWATPLVALTTIADAAGLEIDQRRVGIAGYAFDLVQRVGGTAPTLHVRYARNLTALAQDAQATDHATVLAPQGAEVDGVSATLARAVWRVAAISGLRVTLQDPADGTGPIAFDRQLNGLTLRRNDGALLPIVASQFGDQTVEVSTIGALVVGDIIEVRRTDGSDLISLSCPPAVDEWGPLIGTLPRPDLPGHRNYCPNPATRLWAGLGTTPPDGWQPVGVPTLSRITEGEQLVRSDTAVQVDTTASGSGLATALADFVPLESAPFLSGYVTLWVISGQVRVELVAENAAAETKVYPLGGALATSSFTGQLEDLGLAGIDARAATLRRARLRVVQHGSTPASFIIASAQLTLDAGDAQLSYVDGSGGNALWQATNTALQFRAIPRLVTTVSIADLARLDPDTFRDDTRVLLGQPVRIVYPERAIEGTARLVRATVDYLTPGQTAITLSDRAEDLSGSLARRTTIARRTPRSPIVLLAGDLSASTAFDGDGALQILVRGPEGADSLRAAVSTSGMPSAATVDAATGSLRVDGQEIAVLEDVGPYTPGTIVYISVRAYRGGVGTRLLQLTDAADAADAASGPSLEVRLEDFPTFVRVRYAFIGTLTYRVNDVLTTVPSTPFDIPKPDHGAATPTYVLFCVRNGETATEPIPVYAIGEDTITPDIVVNPISVGASKDRVQFEVFAYDPRDDSPEASRLMLLTGCSAIGFTGAGPHALSQGQIVTILKPLARNPGTVEFNSTHPGGGTARVYRSVAAQDLTGIGVEVLSNPEFREDLPRRAAAYDNGATGLVTLSYPAVAGQNSSGVVLRITKAAGGGVTPGSGGFALSLPLTAAAGFVADAYRAGALYLITVRALVPSGLTIEFQSNPIGTGFSFEWLTSQDGTNQFQDYVLRLQIGVGGTFGATGYFNLSPLNVGVVVWDVAKINWRSLNETERQPVPSLTARRIGGDADTDIIEVVITPATSESRVWLVASTDAPEAGNAIGVEDSSGGVWSLPRRAFRTGSGMGYFRGRTPGFEIAECSYVIPEQGRDTVPLSMTAERVGGTDTTEVVRFFPVDPFPQGTGTLTLTLLPSTASVSPAGPLALTSGSPVDVTITKPAQTSLPAIVGGTLSNPNRVSVYVPVKIEPVLALVPGRIERLPYARSGDDHIERFRTYRSDGTEVTSAGDVATRVVRTPPGGAPVEFDPVETRDVVNGWFTYTITLVPGDDYNGRLINEPAGTARSELAISIPMVPIPVAPPDTSPVITQILTTNTAILDSGSSDGVLELAAVYANLPVGGSVQAVFRQGSGLPETVALPTVPTTVRTPVSKQSITAGRQRLDGSVQLLDSSGGVVFSLSFLSVYFWA